MAFRGLNRLYRLRWRRRWCSHCRRALHLRRYLWGLRGRALHKMCRGMKHLAAVPAAHPALAELELILHHFEGFQTGWATRYEHDAQYK